MLVNTIIQLFTIAVFMLHWTIAHDQVHHECLDNVLFCMPCNEIGLQSLLSTPRAFTAFHWFTLSASAIQATSSDSSHTHLDGESVDDTMQTFHTWLMARKLYCEKEGMQVWVCDDG